MSSIKKYSSAIKQFSVYFSASLIPMLLNLLLNPLVSINMDPEDFAITGYFTSFTPLLSPIISFYFLQYYIKRYFEYNEEQRYIFKAAVFKLLIVYSFFACVLCFIGVLGYIYFFNSDIHFEIFPYLPIALLSIPLTGIYNLELADYKMQKNSSSYFRLSVASGVINSISVLLLVVILKLGALGKLLAPLIVNVAIFVYILIKSHRLLKVKIAKYLYLDMFKFCWPLAGAAMLGYFTNGFDKTYLEAIGNNIEYGYYCVGASMAAYLSVFSGAISNTFQPDIYEAIAINNRQKLLKTFCIQMASIGLVVIVFIIFCPLIVYLLTAGKYLNSVPYTRIIAISTLTSTLYFNMNCYTIAKGFTKISLYTSIIGSLLIVFAMKYFVYQWEFIGGAWMNCFSYIIFFGVNIVLFTFYRIIHEKYFQ